MNDSIIEQVAEQINNGVCRSGTLAWSTSYPIAKRIAETLAKAGLLRPEIDDVMVLRAASVMAEVTGEPRIGRFERTMTKVLLEAALGGEQ